MRFFADLDEFVSRHSPYGTLTGDDTDPAHRGRSCGVVFERWVTPEEVDLDLIRAALLN